MSNSGDRFNWVGAFAANTRGGKEAHPPRAIEVLTKKISKKEKVKAIRSAVAALASLECIKKKYSKISRKENNEKLKNFSPPIIIESKINDVKKTKELYLIIKKVLNENRFLITK